MKNITIRWNDDNVIESTAQGNEDGYLIWNSSLGIGERLNASVKYNLDVFTTNKDEQYTEESGSSGTVVIVILVIIGVVLLIFFLVAIFGDDDYGSHGGFGGRSSVFISHSSCVRSSCACASCACACAGGGRAGCSKKDFYKTNLRTEVIQAELEKKE